GIFDDFYRPVHADTAALESDGQCFAWFPLANKAIEFCAGGQILSTSGKNHVISIQACLLRRRAEWRSSGEPDTALHILETQLSGKALPRRRGAERQARAREERLVVHEIVTLDEPRKNVRRECCVSGYRSEHPPRIFDGVRMVDVA